MRTNKASIQRVLEGTADKRLEILRNVHQCGSISEAARVAGVSYTAAWQAISTLSNLAGKPVVEKIVGGVGGGGTRLTATGEAILRTADAIGEAKSRIFERMNTPGLEAIRLGGMSLRTSMRNQLPCTVTKIVYGTALVSVALSLGDAGELRSKITTESAQLLNLREGTEVLALFKATMADVAADFHREPGFAVLRGKVSLCARQNHGGEVSIVLPNGQTVAGFARAGHGLAVGDAAALRVPSSAVVIALPD